jgi:hypothetical protein
MADFGLAEMSRHQNERRKIIKWLETAVAKLRGESPYSLDVLDFWVRDDESHTVCITVEFAYSEGTGELEYPFKDLIDATL